MTRTVIAVLVIAGTMTLAAKSYADPVRTHEVVRRHVSGDPDNPNSTTPLGFRSGDPENPNGAKRLDVRPGVLGANSQVDGRKAQAAQRSSGASDASRDGGLVAWWLSYVLALRSLVRMGI
ncbi:MAG: hypothetical protein U0167_17360 [bacterium]